MPDITVDVIREIRNTAKPLTVELGGKTYSTDMLYRLLDPEPHPMPKCKAVSSLDALVALIEREALIIYPDRNIYVACHAFDSVQVYTDVFIEDGRWERQDLYTAKAEDIPGWRDAYFTYEEAVIALRSRFIPNEGTAYLLELLSRVSKQAEINTHDNGITQTTVAKKGIALLGTEIIRPIVPLRPYRTFQEVEQPESDFLVRIQEGKGDAENRIGILGADGDMWKLAARRIIRAYLEEHLRPDEEDRILLSL